jgi:hypothetical protein
VPVEELRRSEMVSDGNGGLRPQRVQLDAEARRQREEFTSGHAADINAADFPPHLRGVWSKLRSYWVRLALIVHMLRRVSQETTQDDVDGESAQRATRLVRYFGSQARKVLFAMDADKTIADARFLVQWLKRHGEVSEFTRGQLSRQVQSHRFPQPASLDKPLEVLREHGYLAVEVCDRTGPGRKPDYWLVNPRWQRQGE